MSYLLSGLWCEQTDTLNLSIHPLPQALFDLSDTGQCLKGNMFTATNLSTGTDGNSFWSTNDNQTGTISPFDFGFTQTGLFSVKLVVESDKGCKDSLEKQVEVYAHPLAEFTLNEQAQCLENNNIEATLTSQNATNQNLHWGNGSIQDNAQNQTYTNTYTASGSYLISLYTENEYGCTDTVLQSITIHPQPEGSLDPVLVCEDMPVILRSTNFSSFETQHRLLPNGINNSLNAGVSVNHEGETATLPSYTATLHMESTEGCVTLLTKTFPVSKAPEPTFTWVADRHKGDLYFRFTGSQEGDWKAESGESGSGIVWEAGFNDTGMILITLKVVTSQGCEGEVSEEIPVYGEIELYIPDAFSPNTDGANDTWKPGNAQFIKTYHIRIWNRWGQTVHESTDPNQGWNGVKAQQGVYVYILNATDIYGQQHHLKGTIHLVK
jgi:gliding motility-associated-like protein